MCLTADRGREEEVRVQAFEWYVGIDWGTQAHEFCLLRADGRLVGTRTVAHAADAIHDALRWVGEQTGASLTTIAVGVETRSGSLIDTLLERGVPVFAINPKQLDRFRDRFTAGGAKDDRRDALALADGLRTDGPRAFRAVHPADPTVIELRELSRMVDDLTEEIGRLTNRLREQLFRVDAAWLAFSPAADEPWLWALLADVPQPTAWASVTGRRLRAILRRHRIRRVQAEPMLDALRRPRLAVAPGVADAVARRVASLVAQLRLLDDQRRASTHEIDRLLTALATAPPGEPQEHRDVEILQSLPGVGRMVTATMLGEASALLAARDHATLRAYSGSAPVTRRSGKRHFVHMRYACNRRLRNALYHWARTSIQWDAPARSYYDTLRSRGQSHARALRSVADRWLRILIAMLTARTLYDPARLMKCAVTAA